MCPSLVTYMGSDGGYEVLTTKTFAVCYTRRYSKSENGEMSEVKHPDNIDLSKLVFWPTLAVRGRIGEETIQCTLNGGPTARSREFIRRLSGSGHMLSKMTSGAVNGGDDHGNGGSLIGNVGLSRSTNAVPKLKRLFKNPEANRLTNTAGGGPDSDSHGTMSAVGTRAAIAAFVPVAPIAFHPTTPARTAPSPLTLNIASAVTAPTPAVMSTPGVPIRGTRFTLSPAVTPCLTPTSTE